MVKTIAREISWLSFNARVLQEADDPTVPLQERIRFLAIYSNNLDEFFRVRVAVLKKMTQLKKIKKSSMGSDPQKILDQIQSIVLQHQVEFNRIWKKILGELKKEKVFLVDDKRLHASQKVFVKDFFDREVRSSIIPLLIENMAKLPSVGDENIFLGIMMRKDHDSQNFAIIEIPQNLSRFVSLPSPAGEQHIMLLEDLIRFNLPRIFSHLGYKHFEAYMFKITKDAEIDIDKDISTSFTQKIEKGIKNRRKAQTIRFQYDKDMNETLLEFLIRKLNLSRRDSIIPGGHIRNFRDFMDFPAFFSDTPQRLQPFIHPILAKAVRVSDVIMRQDVLLNVPYHSFNSVIDLLREAAMDPEVKSIKITAYRLAPNSKICNALINAARNGKDVHVFLELRASFNEEANLEWKARLEEEGVKVFVGIPNMKVHAKICVIKKQNGEQYGFIGTGNLNEKTALCYTDHFLLTSDRAIMADMNRIFKVLEHPDTDWRELGMCKTLIVSPVNMRMELLNMIDREIKSAKAGESAEMIVNVNSVTDEEMIKKLYKAAEAGVTMHLIVRSAFCGERAENESVLPISIVDEYLEHGRILLFHNGGKEKLYISSADWMVRNLDYRIEVAVPIKDKAIKNELKHILEIKMEDNVKARLLDHELSNHYVSSMGKKKVRSQRAIYQYLKRKGLKNYENSRD